MLSPRDEILIQRCVDNECSTAERRELLDRLEQIDDGWKALACTYMEEQLFAAACNKAPVTQADSLVPAGEIRTARTHWFHHPALSMVLTACVVFLLGVIGAGEYQRRNTGGGGSASPDSSIADNNSPTENNGVLPPKESIANTRTVSNQPGAAWLEADGVDSRKIPVYSNVPEFMSSFERFRQQGDQWSERLGSRAPRSRIRYIQVQMGDELLLLPVEELSIEQNLQ